MTTPRRLALVLLVFLVWAPAAYAWSWPIQGPVRQPFSYDEDHPYAAGQHRGVDIGADAAGEAVVAPAAGIVSFAGSVAANGESVTIQTADGYSVTLTHLGSIAVSKGDTVAEQDVVGTIGPSGTPEVDGPYVHLGIRVTTDPNGYVDPLRLLPAVPQGSGTQSGSAGTQKSAGGATAPAHAKRPAAPVRRSPRATLVRTPVKEHAKAPTAETQPARRASSRRPALRETRAPVEAATPQARPSESTASLRRPVVEPAASAASAETSSAGSSRRPAPAVLGPAVCNGMPALVAVTCAFLAARGRRRRRSEAGPLEGETLLHLPRARGAPRSVSRAA